VSNIHVTISGDHCRRRLYGTHQSGNQGQPTERFGAQRDENTMTTKLPGQRVTERDHSGWGVVVVGADAVGWGTSQDNEIVLASRGDSG
jgi:hypothetical protein